MYEADEAVSRADFAKSLGWAAKELSETKYWLQMIIKKKWIDEPRITALMDETNQLLKIVKTMKVRTKRKDSD